MSSITEIYKRYKILPALQEHQLRVAAVAKQICNNFDSEIDVDSTVKACLIHDIANILKFDLTRFPQYVKPSELSYWEDVKDQMSQKYQTMDEHQATLKIAKELKTSPLVLECIRSINFTYAEHNTKRKEMEPKICDYADGRVGPHGVLSLDERLNDLKARYANRSDRTPEKVRKWEQASHTVEDQIFAHTSIRPSGISDASIKPIVEELRTYEF